MQAAKKSKNIRKFSSRSQGRKKRVLLPSNSKQ